MAAWIFNVNMSMLFLLHPYFVVLMHVSLGLKGFLGQFNPMNVKID